MLPEGLQRAKGPAETLADQLAGRFRSFRPGNGFFVVADAPAEAADGDGQIGVFGDGVRRDATRGFDGLLAPSAQRAGYDGNAIQQVEGALLHVLAGDVLQRLPARKPARAVADLDVAGDGANLGIGEMANELADGVRFDFRVRVDGHHNVGVRQGHGKIQSRRFSAIHLMNDANARLGREILVQQLARSIRGAVIDNDDAQILKSGEQDGLDGLLDDTLFIVRGNQHRHARRRVGHHGMIGAKLFDQRQQSNNHGALADHHNAEEEDDADEEPGPLKQREDKSIGAGFKALFRGEQGHYFGARFSNQV